MGETKNHATKMDMVLESGIAKRNYRDRVFRMVFEEEEALLELYNALNGTNYDDPSTLTITTLQEAILMHMKNDVSFIIANTLNLYEHQSTWNPNMPLRDLYYLVEQYKSLVDEKRLYSTKSIQLPTPVCIMFYNGDKEMEDVMELKLSDLYTVKRQDASLELTVKVYNINCGHNKALMEACGAMREYAIFVAKVKQYLVESKQVLIGADYRVRLSYAIHKAMEECIRDGILEELLRTRGEEVKKSMLTEYDEEAVLAMIGEEKYEDGYEAGKEDGRKEGREEIITNMLKYGMSWSQIEKYTGMTEEKYNQILCGSAR